MVFGTIGWNKKWRKSWICNFFVLWLLLEEDVTEFRSGSKLAFLWYMIEFQVFSSSLEVSKDSAWTWRQFLLLLLVFQLPTQFAHFSSVVLVTCSVWGSWTSRPQMRSKWNAFSGRFCRRNLQILRMRSDSWGTIWCLFVLVCTRKLWRNFCLHQARATMSSTCVILPRYHANLQGWPCVTLL